MKLATRVARVAGATATVFLLAPAVIAGLNVDQPTFVDDVAAILHANCVSCRQPGDIGPMSLRTYREVRPWARSIARAVENRDMPPWDADPGYGPWLNDISLSDDEIAAIARWAANGAPRGEGDEPVHERPETAGEWTFGEPDWVFEFDLHDVAAEGRDEFRDVVITTGFEEDRWIRAIEVQPETARCSTTSSSGEPPRARRSRKAGWPPGPRAASPTSSRLGRPACCRRAAS